MKAEKKITRRKSKLGKKQGTFFFQPSSFTLHPFRFILHPFRFILRPSHFILLFLCLLLPGCVLPGSSEIERGEQALKKRQPTVAAAAFNQAAKLSHNNAATLQEIAVTYARNGKPADGLSWMMQAARADPSPHMALFLGAILQLHRTDEGCQELSKFTDRFPNRADLLNEYAYLCLVVPGEDLDRAIAMLKRAVAGTGEPFQKGLVTDSLGWAYFQRYVQRKASNDLRQATLQLETAVALTAPPVENSTMEWLYPKIGISNHYGGRDVRQHLIAAYAASPRPRPVSPVFAHHWAIQDCLGASYLQERLSKAGDIQPRFYPNAKDIQAETGLQGRAEVQQLNVPIAILEETVFQQPYDALARLHLGLAYREAYRACPIPAMASEKERYYREAYVELQKATWLDPEFQAAQQAFTQFMMAS